MLRKSCVATLDWVAGFIAPPLTRTALRDWCSGICRSDLAAICAADGSDVAATDEAARLAKLAVRLFPEGAAIVSSDLRPDASTSDLNSGRSWLERRVGAPKYFGGPYPARFGFLLDALAEAGELPPPLPEELLRHVEVRRSGCLADWGRRSRTIEMDVERLGVAVFLYRLAVRHRDLRFLNSGLKIFDWFGAPRLGRWQGLSRPLQRRILLSVLEAEAALEELIDV